MAKFQPGQSGNPGGRPKSAWDLREVAQQHTPKALETLVKIMLDEKAPKAARVMAIRELFDRGHGKALQAHELSGPNGAPLNPQPAQQINFDALKAALVFTFQESARLRALDAPATEPAALERDEFGRNRLGIPESAAF